MGNAIIYSYLFYFNFALQNATRKIKENQKGFKLNGEHQLLAHADVINILGREIITVKKTKKFCLMLVGRMV
jgi:hypothetical protein